MTSRINPIQIEAFGPTGKFNITARTLEMPDPGATLSEVQRIVWRATAQMISATGYSPSSVTIASATGFGAGVVLDAINELDRKCYLLKAGERSLMHIHMAIWPEGVKSCRTIGLDRDFSIPQEENDDPSPYIPKVFRQTAAKVTTRRLAKLRPPKPKAVPSISEPPIKPIPASIPRLTNTLRFKNPSPSLKIDHLIDYLKESGLMVN